jgi:hypothetical protein
MSSRESKWGGEGSRTSSRSPRNNGEKGYRYNRVPLSQIARNSNFSSRRRNINDERRENERTGGNRGSRSRSRAPAGRYGRYQSSRSISVATASTRYSRSPPSDSRSTATAGRSISRSRSRSVNMNGPNVPARGGPALGRQNAVGARSRSRIRSISSL